MYHIDIYPSYTNPVNPVYFVSGPEGAPGPTGPQGEVGLQGIQGEKGEKGNDGTLVTAALSAHINSNTFTTFTSITTTGNPLRLTKIDFNDKIIPNSTYNEFTVQETGNYFISYGIMLHQPVQLNSYIEINGNPDPSLTVETNGPIDNWSLSIIKILQSGDKIRLMMVAPEQTTNIYLRPRNAAYLNILRIS